MGFLIAILTLLLVLDCVVLVFLVLIQLPKKEAGAGLAFGGAASDALFGAGSGNVLTKITKYVAGFFFGLAIVLSVIQTRHSGSASNFQQKLNQPAGAPAALPPTASTPAGTPPAGTPAAPAGQPSTVPGTNQLMSTAPAAESPAVPLIPANTNSPAPTPPK
jgi:preprotein translocase subunit SecG